MKNTNNGGAGGTPAKAKNSSPLMIFKDVNSIDKTLMEKISLIEVLDKKEKAAFFTMLDALVSKKKLKDNLTSALQLSA